MKKVSIAILSLLLALITVVSVAPINAFAQEQPYQAQSEGHVLVMQSDHLSVARRRKIQMTATVTNVEVQPQIIWSSSDDSIATVDSDGVVKGINVGKAVIFARAEVDGEVLTGEFAINVTKNNSLLKNILEDYQVLSYQYSYVDDFYYTNDKEAWQHNFGFGKIYDFVSPYLLLEYDYVRVFFTYEDKD